MSAARGGRPLRDNRHSATAVAAPDGHAVFHASHGPMARTVGCHYRLAGRGTAARERRRAALGRVLLLAGQDLVRRLDGQETPGIAVFFC